MISLGLGLGLERSGRRPSRITGFPFPGEVLTAPAAGQWTADGVPISGETGTTYTVRVEDIGAVLRCGNSRAVRVWHPRDEPIARYCRVGFQGVFNSLSPDVPATDGQTVAGWQDIISGSVATQSTGINQPVFRAADRALEFDGINDGLILSGTELEFFRSKSHFGLIVGYHYEDSGTPAYHTLLYLSGTSPTLYMALFRARYNEDGVGCSIRKQNGGTTYSLPTTTLLTGSSVLMGTCNTVAGFMEVVGNGNAIDSMAVPTGPMPDVISAAGCIGHIYTNTQYFPGKIACLIQIASDNAAFSTLSLNRLQQFAGLCAGTNLGLPIV